MVDEAELVHPGLLDPEEVECLLLEEWDRPVVAVRTPGALGPSALVVLHDAGGLRVGGGPT